MAHFPVPLFEDGELELRYDRGQICIYGTRIGLKKLAQLCLELAQQVEEKTTVHVHLEDYHFLTSHSLIGTLIAIEPDVRKHGPS